MEPTRLPSAVSDVEVFRWGAIVTRTAAVDLPGWPEEVALDGLPLVVDDESLRVSVDGEPGASLPVPGDVRVELALPRAGEPLEPPAEVELRKAAEEVSRLEARLVRVEREQARLDRIQLRLAEPFANRPPRPAPAAAWRGVIEWVEEKRSERAGERLELAWAVLRARERRDRLARRDREARAQRDAAGDAVAKRVVFRLRGGSGPARGAIRVEYQVPGALWTPSYTFRLSRDGARAQLSVKAMVAQATGEPWERVRLSVATADLTRETELPELPSLRIGRREAEPTRRSWREPPPGTDELFAGFDAALARKPQPPAAAAKGGGAGGDEAALRISGVFQRPLAFGGLERTGTFAQEESKQRREAARQPEKPPQVVYPGAMAPPPSPPPPAAAPAAPAQALAPIAAPEPEATWAEVPRPAASRAPGLFSRLSVSREPARGAPPPADEEISGAEMMPAFEVEMEEEAEGMPHLPPRPGQGARRPEDRELRYGGLTMAGWEAGRRGRLVPLTLREKLAGIPQSAVANVESRLGFETRRAYDVSNVPLPPGCVGVAESSGSFDYSYRAEAPVDVPSDGALHSVPLLARDAPVATSFVIVPREGPQAMRLATLENPLGAPLLAGPADVYLGEEFLVTSPLRTVPPGGDLVLGLGVEERLKVARNARFGEEAHGVLGGGLRLDHRVDIEVASRLPIPVQVEVRERVPVREEHDKDVEVSVVEVSPPWEDFDQAPLEPLRGGKRWRFTLPAGEARKLLFHYQVKIDGKNELVGGNRREPA